MHFPAILRTEAISCYDAKTQIFLRKKCLNFMRYETQCLQEWCLISTATVVTSRKVNFAKRHGEVVASLL